MPPKSSQSAKKPASQSKEGDEIENNRKAIKKFLKSYEKACQDKSLTPLPSVVQKLNRLVKSEEGPPTLNIPFLITEECSTEAIQILLENMDVNIPGYEKMSFWRNSINDKTVQLIGKWLQPHPKLKELEIIDNRVSPKGCSALSRALQNNETLTTLILDHNEIGDEGACLLAVGIAWSPSLSKLSLNYCGIQDEGAIALASEAIGKSPSLQILELQGNTFGDRGFEAIATSLSSSQKLQQLNLSGCGEGTPLRTEVVSKICESITQNTFNSLQNIDLNYVVVDSNAVLMLAELAKNKENLIRIRLYERVDKAAYKVLTTQMVANLRAHIQRSKPKKKPKKKKEKK